MGQKRGGGAQSSGGEMLQVVAYRETKRDCYQKIKSERGKNRKETSSVSLESRDAHLNVAVAAGERSVFEREGEIDLNAVAPVL